MKKYMLITGLIAVTALTGTVALAHKECLMKMHGDADKSLFVEYEGKRIYVCKECFEDVKKDPAKYISELEEGGVKLEKAQTACAVMGRKKTDKKLYADYNLKRVYFCCPGCIKQFKKEPDKYMKKLEGEGVVPEPIPAAADAEKKGVPEAEHKHGGGACRH